MNLQRPSHLNRRDVLHFGTRTAYCDFDHEADMRRFSKMLQTVDVFLQISHAARDGRNDNWKSQKQSLLHSIEIDAQSTNIARRPGGIR
jgi:hypothetical protein